MHTTPTREREDMPLQGDRGERGMGGPSLPEGEWINPYAEVMEHDVLGETLAEARRLPRVLRKDRVGEDQRPRHSIGVRRSPSIGARRGR